MRWIGDIGAKVFDEDAADALGFGHYFELGAGLRWGCEQTLPGLSRFGFSGAVFAAGDDITGWSLGMAVEF
ncbi:MAG: hypothetical protein U5M23_09205 [Marinagarivorans sp.]|nr:hypothetical protein [Marinagarivorans sp.]